MMDPLGVYNRGGSDVILGSGFGAIVAVRLIAWWTFVSKFFLKCPAIVLSSVRLVASHPIFCLFMNPLISGNTPFTNRAARAG